MWPVDLFSVTSESICLVFHIETCSIYYDNGMWSTDLDQLFISNNEMMSLIYISYNKRVQQEKLFYFHSYNIKLGKIIILYNYNMSNDQCIWIEAQYSARHIRQWFSLGTRIKLRFSVGTSEWRVLLKLDSRFRVFFN